MKAVSMASPLTCFFDPRCCKCNFAYHVSLNYANGKFQTEIYDNNCKKLLETCNIQKKSTKLPHPKI